MSGVVLTKTEALFVENLKRERKRAGYSQEKLAELLDMSPKYVSALEMGRRYPSPEAFQKIADTLGLEPYQLLIDPASIKRVDETQIIDEFTSYLTDHFSGVVADIKAKYQSDKH
jgi:transcriptional regulator with XRE-family HTH domain